MDCRRGSWIAVRRKQRPRQAGFVGRRPWPAGFVAILLAATIPAIAVRAADADTSDDGAISGGGRAVRARTARDDAPQGTATADRTASDARFYVAGMVATSGVMRDDPFASPGALPTGPGLVGGDVGGEMALGMAVPRPAGWLRLELEGRGTRPAPAVATATGPWSSTVNAWRDVGVTDRLATYAGGGIGIGATGATASHDGSVMDATSGLAWQAGAGVTYAATERVTIDVGYRQRGIGTSGGGTDGEVMVAVRVFEPFRGWLR